MTGASRPLYARCVSRTSSPERSPTFGLLLGLIITLSAVLAYSAYITWQVTGLRKLQTELVDRNRKDSLQLLRIQNDLNLLAVAMRDMVSSDEPYPLTAWSAQFDRIRTDLDDAIRLEAGFASTGRTPEQSAFLTSQFSQFWNAADRIFSLAREGKEKDAREQIELSLQERQAALSTAVARLLVQNSENEEQAGQQIVRIYDRVQRQVYVFLAATLLAILLNGLSLIRWNRRLFARLAEISERRSELAQKLIATQESTLRYISRELHDEFGQILTAVGSMLRRAGTHAPEGSSLRADLQEVLQTVQTTLESVRSLSQALHPVMLDEAGLESTLDWYIPTIERQTGIAISYEKQGEAFPVDGGAGVHVYRVVQEALNNVARHSGAKQAWVRLRFLPRRPRIGSRRSWSRDYGASKPSRYWFSGYARTFRTDGGADCFFTSAGRWNAGASRRSPRESGVLWKRRSQSCWWMITAWCAAVSAACWKMNRTCMWWAKRATARKP